MMSSFVAMCALQAGAAVQQSLSQAASQAARTSAIRFTDVTAESGIQWTTTSGVTPSTQILEVKGGGLALIDFDNDDDLDLFVPNGATLDDTEHGPGARLFRNDGAMKFTDVTASSAITHSRWSFGATVGDVDADGFDDIFIACYGDDVLLRNKGDGTFEDITKQSGLHDDRWSTSAAFADLDVDGDLDLYVCNYLDFDPKNPLRAASFKGHAVMAGPNGYRAARDTLYEATGKAQFADRSLESGIAGALAAEASLGSSGGSSSASSNDRFGLNLAILDFTGDGRPDIFVGNDSQANNLFTNARDAQGVARAWQYVDHGMRSGIAVNGAGSAQATMGVAISDVDGNGRPDVFTTNFSSDTNTLHLNLDGRSFDDRTNQFGLGAISRPLVGWGAGFFDFDHDADEDALVVNGHTYPQATKVLMDSEYRQRPLLMERVGARFEPVTDAGAWSKEAHLDRSVVFADFDRDGDVDFVIAGLNEPLRVIRNDHDSAMKDWLIVVPRDARAGIGNRHAIGAEIQVRSGDAAHPQTQPLIQRRWMVGGGPYLSNNAPEAHFGLGEGTDAVAVRVIFPDGVVVEQTAHRGERIVVDHPEAAAVPAVTPVQ